MLVIIASVPHTATHFLIELLGLPIVNPDNISLNEVVTGVRQDSYVSRHVYSQGGNLDFTKEWGRKSGVMVIAPLRHPMATAQSWRNRGLPISDMVDYFHNLTLLDPQPMYLSIDAGCRHSNLEDIRIATGLPCQTEWEIVGHANLLHKTLSDSDIALVRELVSEPFFVEIYGEDPDHLHIPAPAFIPITVGKMVARTSLKVSARRAIPITQ